MFKKTMEFDNLDGTERVKQTFYFNYNKQEIAELLEFGRVLRFTKPTDPPALPLEEQMKKLSTPIEDSGLSRVENNIQAYNIFRNLILDAFGRKGDDNVTFTKSWDLRNYFESHVAFDDLIFEIVGNEKLAGEFIEKCIPPRLVEAAKQERLKPEQIDHLVEEAARRQADPATRIEPGPEAAARALGTDDPVVITTAKEVPETTEPKKPGELTVLDIQTMSDEEFAKLDVRKLQPEVLQAAFRRKTA